MALRGLRTIRLLSGESQTDESNASSASKLSCSLLHQVHGQIGSEVPLHISLGLSYILKQTQGEAGVQYVTSRSFRPSLSLWNTAKLLRQPFRWIVMQHKSYEETIADTTTHPRYAKIMIS